MGRVRLPLAKVEALDRLYAELPRLECKRLCQGCCGPVPMSRLEALRAAKRSGRRPGFDPGTLACNLLTAGGACAAYAARPMMCRLWGLVPSLRCPHGCEPERWLTDEEAGRFIKRSLALGR